MKRLYQRCITGLLALLLTAGLQPAAKADGLRVALSVHPEANDSNLSVVVSNWHDGAEALIITVKEDSEILAEEQVTIGPEDDPSRGIGRTIGLTGKLLADHYYTLSAKESDVDFFSSLSFKPVTIAVDKDVVGGRVGEPVSETLTVFLEEASFKSGIDTGNVQIEGKPDWANYSVAANGRSMSVAITGTPDAAGTTESSIRITNGTEPKTGVLSVRLNWNILEPELPDTYVVSYFYADQTKTQEATAGTSVQLLGSDAFKRNGYSLIGWTETESGAVPDYECGEIYEDGEDLELYPVWKEIEPESITVAPVEATLTTIGATVDLTATVLPEDALNRGVEWSSSDDTVASVSNGTVTANGSGTADITARTVKGGKSATAKITVTLPPAPTPSPSPSPSPSPTVSPTQKPEKSYEISYYYNGKVLIQTKHAGTSIQLLGEDAFERKEFKILGWTRTEGSATIDYFCGETYGADADLSLFPVWSGIPVTGIVQIEPSQYTFYRLHETVQLKTRVIPHDASDPEIYWDSSDPTVATVSSSGLVTSQKDGTAIIRATTRDGGFRSSARITVMTTNPKLYLSFQKDTNKIKYRESVWMRIYVENPVSDTVSVIRSKNRVYFEGIGGTDVRHTHTDVYEVRLDSDGYANVNILPKYSGPVTVTVRVPGDGEQSRTFTVSGYPTMPQTGPDYSLIYLATALSGAAFLAAVILSVIRRKQREKI